MGGAVHVQGGPERFQPMEQPLSPANYNSRPEGFTLQWQTSIVGQIC